MGHRKTPLTATSKVATVDPRTPPTGTLRAAMDDRMTPMVATNRAATDDPTKHTKTPRAGTVNLTTPTEATKTATADPTKPPRAVTDDQTTPMGVTEAVAVNPTTDHTETPRAVMDDRMTCTAANKVATANPKTKAPRVATDDRTMIAIVDRKVPTEAAPPVAADWVIAKATRKAMVDLAIPTALVPTADRRNPAAVRGYDLVVRNVC